MHPTNWGFGSKLKKDAKPKFVPNAFSSLTFFLMLHFPYFFRTHIYWNIFWSQIVLNVFLLVAHGGQKGKNRAASTVLEHPARNCRLVLLREMYGGMVGMGREIPRRNWRLLFSPTEIWEKRVATPMMQQKTVTVQGALAARLGFAECQKHASTFVIGIPVSNTINIIRTTTTTSTTIVIVIVIIIIIWGKWMNICENIVAPTCHMQYIHVHLDPCLITAMHSGSEQLEKESWLLSDGSGALPRAMKLPCSTNRESVTSFPVGMLTLMAMAVVTAGEVD